MHNKNYARAGGALLAACVLAFAGCDGDTSDSYGDDGVSKKLTITGIPSDHNGNDITVSVMVGMSSVKAGGKGTVSSGSAVIDLKLPSGDVTQPWTGTGGPYFVWMVVGDIAESHDTWADPSENNKQGNPSTDGITGKKAQTDINAETTTVNFSTAVDLDPSILQLFIVNYSSEGYDG
ncbi:MAG: hypothetical protein LBR16_03155 [Treponema sp.]|jgi:hypothetical protein|nr:hypothetical protein [Treponema sp.]